MVERLLGSRIIERLGDKKAIILLGPRQVGKSTLLGQLRSDFEEPVTVWNGDDADVRSLLADATSTLLGSLLGKTRTLIIDEAQRIQNVGIAIKIIIDQLQDVKVIA